MNSKKLFAAALIAALASSLVVGAIADPPKEDKSAGQPAFKLPPGWTQADLERCIAAGTLGKMHEHLAKDVGVWHGKNTMWMAPGADAVTSESKSIVTPVMDGRYTKMEMNGEIPGMGPYNGLGYYGYDNVSKKFVSTWIDNHGTGISYGTGDLSADGKTISWKFTCNCPLAQKETLMRQIETATGPNTKTIEMFQPDPKTGKEYKMMSIELTRAELTKK